MAPSRVATDGWAHLLHVRAKTRATSQQRATLKDAEGGSPICNEIEAPAIGRVDARERGSWPTRLSHCGPTASRAARSRHAPVAWLSGAQACASACGVVVAVSIDCCAVGGRVVDNTGSQALPTPTRGGSLGSVKSKPLSDTIARAPSQRDKAPSESAQEVGNGNCKRNLAGGCHPAFHMQVLTAWRRTWHHCTTSSPSVRRRGLCGFALYKAGLLDVCIPSVRFLHVRQRGLLRTGHGASNKRRPQQRGSKCALQSLLPSPNATRILVLKETPVVGTLLHIQVGPQKEARGRAHDPNTCLQEKSGPTCH